MCCLRGLLLVPNARFKSWFQPWSSTYPFSASIFSHVNGNKTVPALQDSSGVNVHIKCLLWSLQDVSACLYFSQKKKFHERLLSAYSAAGLGWGDRYLRFHAPCEKSDLSDSGFERETGVCRAQSLPLPFSFRAGLPAGHLHLDHLSR